MELKYMQFGTNNIYKKLNYELFIAFKKNKTRQ